MMMWLSKKQAKEINQNMDALKIRIHELELENNDLKKSIQFKDAKIQNQMEGLQHLNRDLDQWETLADMIALFPNEDPVPLTIPNRGIQILSKIRQNAKN